MTRSIRLVAALPAVGSAVLAPALAQAAPRAHARSGHAPRPASAPSTTPSSVTALAGSASATVRWQAPATVDGAPVSSHTVTASTGQTMTADEPNQWAIVPGLTDGTPVTFTVTATSAAGTSPPSAASAPGTPEPVAPPAGVMRGRPQSVSI